LAFFDEISIFSNKYYTENPMTEKPKIFINYRRCDTQTEARLLSDFLNQYEIKKVFFDLESIEYGEDFWETIRDEIKTCNKFLALIGNHWEYEALKRIGSKDYLIKEIEFAIEEKIKIIPVLFYREMPNATDLKELVDFEYKNDFLRKHATKINSKSFEFDLVELAEKALKLFRKPISETENPQLLAQIEKLKGELIETEKAYQTAKQVIKGMQNDDKTPELHSRILELQAEINFLKKQLASETSNSQSLQLKLNEYEKSKIQLAKFQNFTEKVGNIQFEMIAIQGGVFTMGRNEKDNEKPPHLVKVSNFYMAKYPITIWEFRAFVVATKYQTDAEKKGDSHAYKDGNWDWVKGANWLCDVGGVLRPQADYNHPVIHVSWNDAKAYCEWLSQQTGKNYCLPTEAQWEYAAGGGEFERTRWAGSDKESELKEFAWYNKNSDMHTHKVGARDRNKLGLFDMSGNVREWCEDLWHEDYTDAPEDGSAWIEGNEKSRVLRGGSWNFSPFECQIAYRTFRAQVGRISNVGFRICLNL
jgi:formylglycine-generating enzyme required for sulfatase activity